MRARQAILALAVRVTLALATWSFFQPDEYFQSLEVAHQIVFGYGKLTWEWVSPDPIRSILYPALNVPVYWLLGVLGLDHTNALIWGPKILHGILASGTDIWVCEIAQRVFGDRYVSTTMLLSLTSFFHGLCLSRSMSNSLETTLTTIALSHFPWDTSTSYSRVQIRKLCIFAALGCAVRPTNAIIWLYVFVILFWRFKAEPRALFSCTIDVSVICLSTVTLLYALDSAYYGKATITPLSFLRINASAVSLFYGSSPWHYYISQAIPIMTMTALPYVLHGTWLALGPSGSVASKKLLGLIVWTICVYSMAGHKEWRFIHPLLPLMHVVAAKSLVDLHRSVRSTRHPRKIMAQFRFPINARDLMLVLLGLPFLCYVLFFHARAPVEVVHYLRGVPMEDMRSVGFLMPCHSTPLHAYLHRPELADDGRVWSLGCEPPLRGQAIGEYHDQTDVFYDSPVVYLERHFPKQVDPSFPPSRRPSTDPREITSFGNDWSHEWPQILVIFGSLLSEPGVRELLQRIGYREVWVKESGWEGDRRRQGGVRVWRYSDTGY
ncbi:glycosyltransferase family 22 protein [Gelatoporia subvermispora B]|uniref:Mannosyltransferase n=1 Tax=Ceriporiopsis subvermispora (strain B) TaxID=914234 RepID=M2R1T4_CERS8|nr:glycosyltransferase family 22 protein [Gelatoporia subvermispora B]